MDGKGWKQWTRERLSVADFQGYVQDQVVMQFASVAARDAALPASIPDGVICYLEDLDDHQTREGGSGGWWRPLGPRWPNQGTGDSLPSDTGSGARYGDHLWSWKYECALMFTPDGWRQCTRPAVDSLGDYRDRLTGRGVTTLHYGFQVYQTVLKRLYMSQGATLGSAGDFLLVNGAPDAARTTTGWPAAGSGWTYNTPATYLRSLGNGMCTFYCEVTRNAGAPLLTPEPNGDLTTVTMGTVPAGRVPVEITPVSSGGAGRMCSGIINTAGDILLCATTETPIEPGHVISLGGTYRLANLDA